MVFSENLTVNEILNHTEQSETVIEFDSTTGDSVPEPISEPENECNVCIINQSPEFFDWVGFASNMFGIFASAIPIYGFYVAKKRGLRKRIFNSIIVELKNNYNRNPFSDRKRLRGRTFFTFAFESSVNSGDFSHFHDKTQAELSSLYQEMKMFNQYLNTLNLVSEQLGMQNKDVDFEKLGYEKLIIDLRKQILKEIPKTISLIKKEIPKKFVL